MNTNMDAKRQLYLLVTIAYFLSALLFVTAGFTKYYHFVDCIFLLFFSIDVLSRLEKINIYFKNNIYVSTILFFSIFLLFSYKWSPNKEELSENILLQGSLILNSLALYYFVNKYDMLKYILFCYVVFALINNLICLGILPNSFFSSEYIYKNARFIGTSGSSNILAIDLIFATFMTLLLIMRTRNIVIKNVCIINILLTIYTILLTQSKKGLILISLLIIIFFYYYLNSYKKNKVQNLIFLFGILSVLAIGLNSVILNASAAIIERLNDFIKLFTLGYGKGSADDIRVELIMAGWNEFINKALTGHGQKAFEYKYHFYSHNNYIELLYNLGIIGFVLYYSMFIRFFSNIRKSFPEVKTLFLGICMIILFMDNAAVTYSLRSHMLFLTILSIILRRQQRQIKTLGNRALNIRISKVTTASKNPQYYPSPVNT